MIHEPINNKGVYGVSVQKIKSILSDIKVTSKNSNQSLSYETWLWMAILTEKIDLNGSISFFRLNIVF